MQKLTITHARNWQIHRRRVGYGHLYQGRYKSFPIRRRRALLPGRSLCRTQRPAGQPCPPRRGVEVFEPLAPRERQCRVATPVERLAVAAPPVVGPLRESAAERGRIGRHSPQRPTRAAVRRRRLGSFHRRSSRP
jgi:hypothetical protein